MSTTVSIAAASPPQEAYEAASTRCSPRSTSSRRGSGASATSRQPDHRGGLAPVADAAALRRRLFLAVQVQPAAHRRLSQSLNYMRELHHVPGVAATVKPRYYVIGYWSIAAAQPDRRHSKGNPGRSSRRRTTVRGWRARPSRTRDSCSPDEAQRDPGTPVLPHSADAHAGSGGPRPLAQFAFSRCQTAIFVPAAPWRPGFEASFAVPMRGGGAPRRKNCRAGKARRAPSLGALASRRSTLAILGSGCRILPAPAFAPKLLAMLSRPGRNARQAVSGPPKSAVASRGRRTPTSRSAFRITSRTRPLIERDNMLLTTVSIGSQ